MFKLPSTVQIGPVTYDVKEEARTASGGMYGQILFDSSLISLQPGMADSMKEITLFHEMVHAYLIQAGISDHDERIIGVMGHAIVDMKKQNPGLFKVK